MNRRYLTANLKAGSSLFMHNYNQLSLSLPPKTIIAEPDILYYSRGKKGRKIPKGAIKNHKSKTAANIMAKKPKVKRKSQSTKHYTSI